MFDRSGSQSTPEGKIEAKNGYYLDANKRVSVGADETNEESPAETNDGKDTAHIHLLR